MKYLLNKYKLLILLLIIPNIFLIFVTTYRTDKSVTLPGGLTLVDDYYQINDGYKASGTFNSLFVISFDNSTLFQNFILQNSSSSDTDEINEAFSHMNDLDWYNSGVIQKQQSEEASLITSYKYASMQNSDVKIDYSFIGAIVYLTTKNDTIFKIGDIITEVNDVKITSNQEFIDILKEDKLKIGDKITIIRNKQVISTVLKQGDVIACYSYDKYKINELNTLPKFQINKVTTVGPSAGLLQSLSLYNQLILEDITKGLTICGTGTIDNLGNVGAIGGIKQKIITANNNNADIFLCPSDNYEDALKAYNKLKNPKMKLYSVSTFNEALESLVSYE